MELLDLVGLADKATQYPAPALRRPAAARRASRGRWRCGRKMLLFDEPTSALDPELVGEVLGVIAQARARARPHHAARDPRDALRPGHLRPRLLLRQGPDRRGRPARPALHRAARGAHARVPEGRPRAAILRERIPHDNGERQGDGTLAHLPACQHAIDIEDFLAVAGAAAEI